MSGWFEEGMKHIWLPYRQMKTAAPPQAVHHTEGSQIHLADGRVLIDGIASWWTAVHGYNHPHIVAALQAQAAIMPHVMLGGLLHEQAAKLATRLAALLPGDLNRVFFSESGSVAVEVAMKMAVQYWLNQGIRTRTKFIAFKSGYHGDTFATMAICDPDEGMHQMFAGALPEQFLGELPNDDEQGDALDRFLGDYADEVAGIIVEPLVQGAGGMVFHSEQTLQRLRALADKHQTLLIFDEIFTGFGRLGPMWASQAAGVVPDIMTIGKALTGGALPLAATVASEKIFARFWSDDPLHALMHGPTFMGNAMACAAANASLDLFESENRLRAAFELAQKLAAQLGPCLELPGVTDVRVRGGIGVVELAKIPNLEALRQRFAAENVWIRPLRNVVYLTPALTIGDEELEQLTNAVRKVLESETP